MHFRVELYEWDDCKSAEENRIECIRNLVDDYGTEWMVYQIGIPNDKYVPMTFVKTKDWERQRQLVMEAVMS